jgi:hypothetical protein
MSPRRALLGLVIVAGVLLSPTSPSGAEHGDRAADVAAAATED